MCFGFRAATTVGSACEDGPEVGSRSLIPNSWVEMMVGKLRHAGSNGAADGRRFKVLGSNGAADGRKQVVLEGATLMPLANKAALKFWKRSSFSVGSTSEGVAMESTEEIDVDPVEDTVVDLDEDSEADLIEEVDHFSDAREEMVINSLISAGVDSIGTATGILLEISAEGLLETAFMDSGRTVVLESTIDS